jgi:predicted acylesterase/phospholipase RssA/ABC-type phosphate/phosphonate transport system substrate-binding protein
MQPQHDFEQMASAAPLSRAHLNSDAGGVVDIHGRSVPWRRRRQFGLNQVTAMRIKSVVRTVILLLPLMLAQTAGAKEIRVGITEYQNVESAYSKYEQFFQSLERASAGSKEPVTFRFAIGTYSEVSDWYNKQLIDVAVLSAMPMADLLSNSQDDEREMIRDAYLGSLNPIGKRVAQSGRCECQRALDEEEPRCLNKSDAAGEPKSHYSVSVVVPAEYGWKSFEGDVRRHAGQGKLKFLFVRPLSISGYMIPSYFLREVSSRWGIDLTKEDSDFTFQHQNSLQRMLQPYAEDEGKYLVAFVIDDTSYCVTPRDASKPFFTRLESPQLTVLEKTTTLGELKVPHEAILVNYYLEREVQDEYKRILKRLFAERPETPTFSVTVREDADSGDWRKEYETAIEIYKNVRVPRTLLSSSTFGDIINSLTIFKDSTGKEPRLALVLSGGGAKSAYQAGAVAAIEDKLRELRASVPAEGRYRHTDFNLVVGTSGGAINALLVALGGTSSGATQNNISEMWMSFKQKDFFKPSPLFSLIFGLLFGLLQALAICLAVLIFGREHVRWSRVGKVLVGVQLAQTGLAAYLGTLSASFAFFVLLQVVAVLASALVVRATRTLIVNVFKGTPGNWWRTAGWLMLLLSTLEILLYQLDQSRFGPLMEGGHHTLHHLWLIMTLVFSTSFPWPLLLGGAMVLSGIWKFRQINWAAHYPRFLRALTMAFAAVAVFLILQVFIKEKSASNASEIENAFINKIPVLISKLNGGFEPAHGENSTEKLRDISRRIAADPGLIKRDLVITVSRLPLRESATRPGDDVPAKLQANQLPEDLYFYFKSPAQKEVRPARDKRFVAFANNPESLLEVVIGSGTIYPLFPYRELKDIRVENGREVKNLKIIDGGFIHNSPVEAAIKWDATHIILIEASPMAKPYDPTNLLDNAFVAFKYIMAQTQRTDLLHRGSVEIFELRPTSECDKRYLLQDCKEDPAPNMDTFDFSPHILKDAFAQGRADAGSNAPLFKRVPGPPLFRRTRQRPESQTSQEGQGPLAPQRS